MINEKNATEIAASFLSWLLQNRVTLGDYTGLWGGNEFVHEKKRMASKDEHWDVWTTTMNVVHVLLSLGFSYDNHIVLYPLTWLKENYNKKCLPLRRRLPILKTLYLIPGSKADIEDFYKIVLSDIDKYIEKADTLLKESDSDKYLEQTDAETPYHILSCYLDKSKTKSSKFILKPDQLNALLKLYLKTSDIYAKQHISHRLSYALSCLNQIHSDTKAKEALIKASKKTFSALAEPWLSVLKSLDGRSDKWDKWDDHSSVTNLYQILSFVDYKDALYFSEKQKVVIEKAKQRIGLNTPLANKYSLLDYLFGEDYIFYENGEIDHFKEDPEPLPSNKSTGYHTYNKAYTTIIGLRVLMTIWQLNANKVISRSLCSVKNYNHLMKVRQRNNNYYPMILHLSDIHCGKDSDKELRPHFIAALKEFFSKDGCKIRPNIIVASGDLTSTGNPQEFEELAEFINKVADVCGISNDRIIFSPGNHDINRDFSFLRYLVNVPVDPINVDINKYLEKNKLNEFDDPSNANNSKGTKKKKVIKAVGTDENKEFTNLDFVRFMPYKQFVYDFYQDKSLCDNLFDRKKEYTIHILPEFCLIIVAFNSLVTIDWNPLKNNKMEFTSEEMLPDAVLEKIKIDINMLDPAYYNYLKIGILHAPIPPKSLLARKYLSAGFHVCLSGHVHQDTTEVDYQFHVENDNAVEKILHIFTTGSLSRKQRDYNNGHSFEIFGINELRGEYSFYPIKCSFLPNATELKDKNIVIGGKIIVDDKRKIVFDQFPNEPSRFRLPLP